MDHDPEPGDPEEHGVSSETPGLAQIEAAQLLANDARDELRKAGFSDDEIRHWAETYVARRGGTADLEDFLTWIEDEETR